MVFELLWFLCLQGTKIQHEQMSVTPERAPVTNNRILESKQVYRLACRTWAKGYSQEPLWLQSNHITAKFHPIIRGDVMEAISWRPPFSHMP